MDNFVGRMSRLEFSEWVDFYLSLLRTSVTSVSHTFVQFIILH